MKKPLHNNASGKIFMLCWVAYTLAYVGRVNLSVAIPIMESSLDVSKSGLGLISTSFFWCYALGQLINGRLGDHFHPVKFIFWGLFASGVLNLWFGFSSHLVIMIFIWGLNGYFQSMLWGPILKTLNGCYGKKKMQKMALYFFTTVISGFFIVWGVFGIVGERLGWEAVFLIPGLLLMVYAVIWIRWMSRCFSNECVQKQNPQNMTEILKEKKIQVTALSAISVGFVREGIAIWMPAMLVETFSFSLSQTMGYALVIPLFNFVGVVISRTLIGRYRHVQTKLIGLFFMMSIGGFLLLYVFHQNMILYLLFITICSFSLYGATSIITSIIPLDYDLTSSVAGFLDFAIYLGAGLSGFVTGWVSQYHGWQGVIMLWLIVCILGGSTILFSHKRKKQKNHA